MIKRYGWLAAVMAVVLAVTLSFTPGPEWVATASTSVGILALGGCMMIPAVRRATRVHRRAVMIAGGMVLVLAIFLLVIGIAVGVVANTELVAAAFTFLLLTGLMLIQLPRLSSNIEGAVAAQKMVGEGRGLHRQFQPVGEVENAIAQMWVQRGALLRIVGPWYCGLILSYISIAIIAVYGPVMRQHRNWDVPLLIALLASLLAIICFFLISLIQWTRFVATNGFLQNYSVPRKALWGWFWRCLIFGPIFNRGVTGIDTWLKIHLPHAASWQLVGLDKLALVAILVLASPFALGLPAVALDRPSGIASRAAAFKLVGRKYYLGIGIILSPYMLVTWGIDVAYRVFIGSPTAAALLVVEVGLFLATALVGMTYVTRTFLKGEAVTGVAMV